MRSLTLIDVTKWAVVRDGFLNASGCNEVVATFTHKHDAQTWARNTYGRYWRRTVSVIRREDLAERAMEDIDTLTHAYREALDTHVSPAGAEVLPHVVRDLEALLTKHRKEEG